MTHKPKVWTGTETGNPRATKPFALKPDTSKPAKTKPIPKALAEPAEKIPDEIEVFDEQRAIDLGA